MRSFTKLVFIGIAVIFCAVLALKGSALLISSGTWQATGNLSSARAGTSAALLQDGRILITGGSSGGGTGAGPQTSADLFNTDGTISPASPMTNARSGHISVTLQNGKVLVAGGITAGGSATSTAEVFDPIANSWTPMGLGMNEARSGATAALLSDGRVLIAGGQNGTAISSTIEIFDPNLGVFTSAGMMSSPRTQHAMTVLQDGRVLIVGGNNGTAPVASTDIFDPVAGTVSAGPVLNAARFGHSATTLLNGVVVVIGGNNGNAVPAQADATAAEMVDFTVPPPTPPAPWQFTALAANLATPREGHLAVLLPNNNNILIIGGTSAGTAIASAELFTPQESPQGVWTYGFGTTGTMTAARSSAAGSANQVNVPSSTMVRNGVVMVAGGTDVNGSALNTTEAYGYPTVQTDQSDYPPGTTVRITGSGFQPLETITIQLVESPVIDTHGPYTVQADANGNFVDTSFTTDLHDVNVQFYLSATGGTSGFQPQNTFTDSKPNTVTLNPTSVTVAPGSSAQYTVTVDFNGNLNNPCTSPLSIQTPPSLPTGATASFSPTSVTGSNANSSPTSTLTITTTNATPPGSTTFNVLAGNGTGCQAGTATGTGTLVVVENTTTTLTSSVNPTVFGQSTTLKATVAQVTGPTTPTGGTVTFMDGAATLGTATLVNGTATLPVSTLTVAGSPHSLTASYAGVANTFGASNSNTVSQTVNQASTTTALTSSANPSVFGQSVTFTATVTDSSNGSTGTPTGTVTFKDSAATLGTGTLNGSGQATLSTTTLTAGSHLITAVYAGDTNFTTSTSSPAITQTVIAPPTIAKSFGAATIPLNTSTSLTFTITNPAANTVSLIGVAFTDTLPAGLVVATPNGLTGTCGGGTITATQNTGSVSLSGATLATNSSCTFSVNVTGTTAGVKNNSVTVSSTNGGPGNAGNASVTVVAPPTISKTFGSPTVPLNGNTSLSFTVTNPNTTQSLSSIAFSDTLPAGLVVSTPNGQAGTCGGGTITATAGGSSISLSGATLALSASCTFSVNVKGTTAGVQNNTTTAISSTEGGTGGTASASMTVVTPPTISKLFGAATIPLNGTTSLSFTITNPNAAQSLSGVAFTDSLPAGLQVVPPGGATGSCGSGTITAKPNATSITLTGGTIAANGSCTFSVNVVGVAAGVQNNTTTAVSSTEGGNGNTASASVTVVAPPTISKTFGAATIPLNGTTSLTFSITNPTANAVSLTGVAFTDTLPAGLIVSTPNNGLTGTCGAGTITATAGSGSISLSGATLAANSSCTFSVNVTGTTAGAKSNSVTVTSTNGGTGNTSTATVTVASPPTISKSFGAATIPLNGSTNLSFTITNPNTTQSLSGIAFSDTLPTGLVVSTPNGQTGTCGSGTISAAAGGNSISLSAATLAASATCTFSVNVTGTTAGVKNNTTTAISSTEGGTGGTASATLTVASPPTISKLFGAATIPVNGTTSLSFTITNPGANTVSLTGVAFTDTLPAGLIVSTPNNGLTGTCGAGTITATAGSGSISLSGATLAANSSCTFSVNVTGTTSGVKNNAVTVSSTNGGTGNTSTASITVASPPTISKVFGASSITLNTSTSLTFTITNTNTIGLTGVAFSDSLPAGLVVATPNSLSSTCGGTPTAVAGSGSAGLSGGTVAASSSCSISLNVTATALGPQNNTTGTITSNESGPGATSNTAMLTVTGTPPTITGGSTNSTTFTAGVAGSFTVMASGTPTPSLSDGGVTLPGSVTFTDNHNGTATLAGTATVAGSYQFTITAQNAVGTATQAFTLIVNAGAAASISVASGSGQTATVNTAFTNPLVALVQDIFGNAVPSVTVTFTAPGNGPSGTFANGVNTAMTDAGGMATSAAFTANNTAGSYTVTASAPSVTNMASFSLTNAAGSFSQLQLLVPGETAAPGTATGKTGTPNTEYVNGAFNVTVNAVDQFFNPVNTVGDTVQITSNDSKAKLPSNAGLSMGTGTFSVTLETVSYNPATTTITASDVTDGSKTASTSPAITVIVVYTATISPTMAGTGDATAYTLTVNNAAAPNTNNLASVEIAVPSADQGTITGATVTATNQGPIAVNWTFDSSKLPGTLRFFENTANDAVTPGGTITITFTATSNATISMSPVYEVWNTTAFSDAASQNALPLAPPEPTVSIGQAPAITSASSTNAFTYGTPNTTFTVSATGTPIPTLSESGSFPSWATFKDNGDRTATISGTPTAAGTSTFTITAHNGFGPDATQTFMLTVQKADQTITVTMPAPAMAVYNTNFTVAATASSGNAVSFSSSGVCMNSVATFTMTSGTGSCTVKFDQAGDSNYNAAPEITESVAAQKAGQTITVTIPAPAMAFFASQFTVAATASSGNTVSFYSSGVCTNSGATFTMTSGTGICTVKFDQAGDANYNPAPEVTEYVTAEKVPQTISFGALSDQTFGDPPFTVSATATSSLAVMFSSLTTGVCTTSGTNGSTVTMIAAGTCTIEADQPGDADYLPAPSVTQSFKVNKAVTTTTLSSSGATVVGGPVTFTVSVADASAGSTGTPSGTVTISDGNYAIGLITLNSGGGSFTTTLLSSTGSPHNINAHYNGDPNFQTSDATAVSQAINTRGTSTTLAFNPAQGTFETPDTITATVAETAGLPSPSGTPDSFTGSGNLGTARKGSTATQLLSGLVLVVGGRDANSNIIGSAELYNPATGNSAPSGGTPIARYGAAAAQLADGRVLIVGGTGSGGVLNSAEIYNPTTDSFSSTASLSVARANATATPLTSGKVVVIGGSDGTSALSSVEVFDPAANSGAGAFSNPGSGTGLGTARFGHVAALLANGTILVAGGNSGSAVLNSAEIYDPTANTSTALTATLIVAREFAGAAEMPNNYVLVAGGDSDGSTPVGSADLYDPQSQKFYASNATLGTARTQLAAVQVNDGRVLAVGGAGPVPPSTNAALTSVEPYTPAFTPQGAVALSSTGSGDNFTGTCQLQPATPTTSPAQSTCTETIDPGSAGTDSVTGNYPADVVHSSSSSGAISFTVNPATTSTTVSSSANPSIFGQSVTFTAVVSNTSTGSTGIPTGSVNFSIDGGAAVTGTSASCPSGSPTYSLCATYSTASLTGNGSPHSATAKYVNADGNFNGSDNSASPLMQTVKPAPTSTTVSSSVNPSIFGQPVTFTATVMNTAAGGVSTATPTGSVQFYVDSVAFGSPVTMAGSGATSTGTSGATATLTVSGSPHTVTANYINTDGNFSNSNGTLSGGQRVNPAPTSTSVSSSVNPSIFGQSMTFTATVTNTAGAGVSTATPTGSVQFYVDTVAFGSPVPVSGSGPTATGASGATATLTVSGSPHMIKATYTNSDGNFSGSYGSLSGGQTVKPAPTSASVSSSVNPSIFGQSVTFTATVMNTAGAGVSTATPTGTVQFVVDGVNFGTPVALVGSGASVTATSAAIATLTVNGSPHTVTANYVNADGNFSNSSGTLSGGQRVNPAATSTMVSSSANPSIFGQAVTFTATVANTSTSPTPTGSVQFVVDGVSFGAPAPLTAAGTATSGSTSTLSVAGSPHSVTANYVNADGNFSNSSGTLSGGQKVNPAATSTVAATAAAVYGQPNSVVLSATVTAATATVNEGTVTFTVVGFGSVTSTTVSGGSASASISVGGIPAGTFTITATYNPGPDFLTSSGSNFFTVTQASTTTTVSSSTNGTSTTFMQAVTFTATVAPQYSGTPTGSVSFYDATSGATCANLGTSALLGTQPLNATASASLTTASLAGTTAGDQHNILACYLGDSNFFSSAQGGSTSSPITQTVFAAPVVTISPTSIAFMGQNVNTTSKPGSVTLRNVGDATLYFQGSGITISGMYSSEFAISSSTCGASVAAGSSCIIYVTFKPVDTGTANATLQILDNDNNNVYSEQDVALTGAGLSTLTSGSFYTDAIFATANTCGSITMSGGSTVDSFNSAQGYGSSHQLSGGNVGTNGNVTLNGGTSTIYGTAAVDSTTSGNCSKSAITGVTSNGGAQVTGGLIPLNGPMNFAAPPAPYPVPATTSQNVSHSCPSGMTGCSNDGNNAVALAPGSYGNVQFNGGTTAHFKMGTYNFNSLTLTGNSILYVDSGPVMINIAGASLNGSSPAMDLSGGSVVNPTWNPANLQFFYGGSRGFTLSGGSQAYASAYAPMALVNMSGGTDFFGGVIGGTITNSGGTNMHYDANILNMAGGDSVWLAAVVNNVQIGGKPITSTAGQVKLYFTNSSITYTVPSGQNAGTFTVPVPNGVVTFNSAVFNSGSGASTVYDLTNQRWSTNVGSKSLTGNTFVAGVEIPVPAGGFPNGLQNVQWSAAISTDAPNVTLQWQWNAGVYNTAFGSCYALQSTNSGNPCYNSPSNNNVLGVNPEDGSADINGTDPAGTPETYKQNLTGTGFFSAAAEVVPTAAEMSTAPSSYSFGTQSVTVPTGVTLVSVLTNNDTNTHNINSAGIAMKGTNAADFVLQTSPALAGNCVGMTSLAPGGSCNLYVVFTPSTSGTEDAKIAITDDANNSPQTVYLSGTGQ